MTTPLATSAALYALPGIQHGFFGREGGVSTGQFASLNTSEAGEDDPAAIAENRARIAAALGVPAPRLATVRQTHSAIVLTLTEPTRPGNRPEADAIVTALPGLALAILTADCTPILFADAQTGIIGAAHAGWKGAVNDIALNTIDAMVALGANRTTITAAIGPAISGPNYEVGPQFAAEIIARHPEAVAQFTIPPGKRDHFDLPGFVEAQLRAAGIGTVENLHTCTYAAPDHYFSHRYVTHHGGATGRQMAVITRR